MSQQKNIDVEVRDLVSVVVPVYNTAKYIDECIQSILNQSYEHLELILVDDGSVDGSERKVDEWEKMDDRIKVIHQMNMGVSSARNHGIKEAKGEYICFVDSDDYVQKDYIKVMVSSMSEYHTDLVSFKAQGELKKPGVERLTQQQSFLYLFRNDKIGAFVCNKLYRSSIINEKQILFNPKLAYGEDLVFAFDYIRFIKNSVYIESDKNAYYYYRENDESAVHRQSIKREKSNVAAYRSVLSKGMNLFDQATLAQAYKKYYGFCLHMILTSWKENRRYDHRIYCHYMRIVHQGRCYLNIMDKCLFVLLRIYPHFFYLGYVYFFGGVMSRIAMKVCFMKGL